MRWGRLSSPSVRTACRRLGVAALAAIGLFTVSTNAVAQGSTGSITGRVTDAATGNPLVGAAVRVGATQIGAQTADDGRFTIRGVAAGTVELQVNRIGYEAKKVPVTVTAGGTATADVKLSQAAFSLSEVVVTVTGAQKKAEISNTVASVDIAAKVEETTANSLGQLLSGQAAGVQVVSGGAAGAGSRIRIRGQSSLSLSNNPVVYIDGIKVSSNNLAANGSSSSNASRFDDLNPDEIENIDILKGPAAATLYGTEAANGVINITTKKGKAGKTRWNFFGEDGVSKDPSYGNYRDLWISFQKNANGSLTQCMLTQVAAGQCRIDSTYHGNVLNNPATSPIVNGGVGKYGLQVSGGNDRNQYFVSGEYNHEMGPYKMPQSEISRISAERGKAVPYNQIYPSANGLVNLRTNLSTQLGSKADFNVSLGYIEREYRKPANEDNSLGLMVDAIAGLARTDLYQKRSATDSIALNGYRSYPMGDVFAQQFTSDVNRFINSLNFRYYPLSWLSTRANLGFDWSMDNTKQGTAFDQGPFGETVRQGDIQDQRTETNQYTADIGGTATFSFWNQWTSKTSIGTQYFRNYTDNVLGRGRVLPPGATQVTAGATQTTSEGTGTTITLGQYAEQVLSYADRFFLTGGLRYDGNSAFGKSFKGVFYPKIGASWLLGEESFFPKNENWFNNFRVRATYGASGVQPGTIDAVRYYESVTGTINGADQPGVRIGSLGNAHLRPEYSGEFETGFDLTTFHGKTTVEYTYYNKKTKDALIARPLAPSLSGIATVFDNLGSIRNQGMELTLNNRIIDNNEMGFDLQITGSTNKNRILTLGQGVTPVFTGNRQTQYNAPGYPLYAMFGKVITYADKNGDGLLTPNEVCQDVGGCRTADTAVYFGPSYPTFEMAINPRIELLKRKLAIAAQFDHKQGMDKFNNTLRHQSQGGLSAEGFWDPNSSLLQQARTIAVNNYSVYSGMYENGRFTRLREVSVSYQLPDALAAKLRSSRASIVAAGRNLHVWTPYTGVDPEATVGNGDERGNEEYFSTPPLRYFTVRLNLAF